MEGLDARDVTRWPCVGPPSWQGYCWPRRRGGGMRHKTCCVQTWKMVMECLVCRIQKHSCDGATYRSAILICFHRPQYNHSLYFLRDAKTKCGFGQWFHCGFLPALQSKYKTLGTGRVLLIVSHIIRKRKALSNVLTGLFGL